MCAHDNVNAINPNASNHHENLAQISLQNRTHKQKEEMEKKTQQDTQGPNPKTLNPNSIT